MEPVLFYGVPHGCSFGSIVALEWLGRPYRLCRIEMPVDAEERTYVRLNPARQTPALLLEDGRVLNESLAILQHLAARDLCRKLGYPQGSAEFDELNFVLALLHTECHSAWGALFYLAGAGQTAQAGALAHAARAYGRIESLLGERKWLAGEGPSVADAYLAGTARWGRELGYFDLASDFPRLHRHLEKLEQDPAVRFAHAIEDGLPAQTSGEFKGEVALEDVASRLLA
ncbi:MULTISPECIES: glutathione S-transferase family protein [Pseudomonas aeruginosa group]|uniref:Glutathione S-transferase family protein n=1 Tax=Pseudomonas aeruginosa TaxID=287 RepID=A0ABD7K7W6_PSEAI|nr:MULTISPECIES: glutathione S-transferase family protein [Pseudomonas aeruginosa group]KSC43927.1 glutathione S-transferase [Pseudomonas paraeruginosa]KSL14173.1 glutathione S-transferase [Pseudomonas aeruginosa]MBH8713624.1 glutathione S-transferase family protein [Pseudomonas aeruginosa]MBH9396378.1 glutathione S-transferase family protein [Pseudomonas aeruginosa]MBI8115181.1 glutathione S-transferase family protein [Pseudomonas aeruginosa]